MNPRFVIAALLILALAVPATMMAQGSKAEKEVRAVIDQINAANLKGGSEAAALIDKYYADDYVRILNNGEIYTKAVALDSFRTGRTTVQSAEISDLKIRTYGNTAVATGFVKSKGTSLGLPNSPTGARWTRVFVKRSGVWQCVLYQTTPIAK